VVRIRDPEKKSSRIPDPWGNNAPDPGSATLYRTVETEGIDTKKLSLFFVLYSKKGVFAVEIYRYHARSGAEK
jgi:hypothetical protein